MREAREQSRATAAHLMAMARNIAQLKSKPAKQEQAHKLCDSLKKMISEVAKPMGFRRETRQKPDAIRHESEQQK